MYPQISWFTLFISSTIILLSWFIYSCVIRPYRQYSFYKSVISSNYKALIHPFSIISTRFIETERRNVQKYGDSQHTTKFVYRDYQLVMGLFQGVIVIDLIDPQLVKQFFQRTMEGCYIKAMKSILMEPIKQVLGNGLLFSEQNEWRMKRKIMSSVFNYDFIKSKVGVFLSITNSILDKIEANPDNLGQINIQINVNLMLQQIFGNVVIKCFFGNIQLYDIEGQSVFTFFSKLMQLNIARSKSILALTLGHKFAKCNLRAVDRKVNSLTKHFQQYATNVINNAIRALAQKEKNGKKGNDRQINGVVELLINQKRLKTANQAKDIPSSDKNFYTVNDLIDQFKTFYFAGTDTTANNTTILIYLLSRYKNIQEKIRKQIETVLGNNLSDITFEKLKELKYLQKVQKQALRMYSPSNGIFKRQATRQHFIGKIPIKKGTTVAVLIKPNHFKQSFYQNPEMFNPDRWDKIDQNKAESYSYYPFSSGQRNCIGQHLAIIQSRIVIVQLLLRYKEIILQKPEFRLYYRTLYGAEDMTTTFVK